MSRKKTHEEYVSELAIKNPNVEVIEEYINAHTPILHHCLIHDIHWKPFPYRVLSGSGCKECKKEKIYQSCCKFHSQYVEEVKLINPYIEIVGQYINAKTKIAHYCKKHNVLWDATPTNILNGEGCWECGREKIKYVLSMTHEEYVSRVLDINPNIEVMGVYKNANDAVLHRCKVDGYVWSAFPSNILNGHGCPKCAGCLALTHEEYVEKLALINSDVSVIGKYVNMLTPILHVCLIDGHIWSASPSSILHGSGCPKCAGNIKRTHAEYVAELFIVNPDIEAVELYINARTPILHRCMIDGYEWNATPENVLNGSGCPQCQESNGERQIRQWLQKHGIEYIYQKSFTDCKDKKELPFDFYVPQYNVCIEYDGEQHFEPVRFGGYDEELAVKKFTTTKYHDQIKTQYCKNNNIHLLRIPYHKNVEEELNNYFYSFNIVT